MIRLAAALLVLVAPLASAQTLADAWPLAPGNSWTYTLDDSEYRPSGGSGTQGSAGATTWTVLDSVETATGRLPRVDFGAGECLVETQPLLRGIRFALVSMSGDAPCETNPAFGIYGPDITVPFASTDYMPTLSIGGVSVPYDSLRQGLDDNGGGSIARAVSWQTVDGLGVTQFAKSFHATGTINSSTSATLRQATIGGRSFGQPLGTRDDFWPLAVGNRWEYRITDRDGVNAGEVAWTVETAGTGFALRMQHVRDGAVVSSVTCPISVGTASPATTWMTPFILAGCTLPDRALAPNFAGTAETLSIDLYTVAVPVRIGAQAVNADAATGFNALGYGPNGPGAVTTYSLARSIGPVSYSSVSYIGDYTRWDAALAFARVGGMTYGQQVVGSEGEPDAAAVTFTVGPNPTRGALALSFALPAAAEATAEVLDALGRRVLRVDLGARVAGAGSARLDLSGLAPGAYVVRLEAGRVRASMRVSIVR